jgi:hypothetical protein
MDISFEMPEYIKPAYSVNNGMKKTRGTMHPAANFKKSSALFLRLGALKEFLSPLKSNTTLKGIAIKIGDVLARVPKPNDNPAEK